MADAIKASTKKMDEMMRRWDEDRRWMRADLRPQRRGRPVWEYDEARWWRRRRQSSLEDWPPEVRVFYESSPGSEHHDRAGVNVAIDITTTEGDPKTLTQPKPPPKPPDLGSRWEQPAVTERTGAQNIEVVAELQLSRNDGKRGETKTRKNVETPRMEDEKGDLTRKVERTTTSEGDPKPPDSRTVAAAKVLQKPDLSLCSETRVERTVRDRWGIPVVNCANNTGARNSLFISVKRINGRMNHWFSDDVATDKESKFDLRKELFPVFIDRNQNWNSLIGEPPLRTACSEVPITWEVAHRHASSFTDERNTEVEAGARCKGKMGQKYSALALIGPTQIGLKRSIASGIILELMGQAQTTSDIWNKMEAKKKKQKLKGISMKITEFVRMQGNDIWAEDKVDNTSPMIVTLVKPSSSSSSSRSNNRDHGDSKFSSPSSLSAEQKGTRQARCKERLHINHSHPFRGKGNTSSAFALLSANKLLSAEIFTGITLSRPPVKFKDKWIGSLFLGEQTFLTKGSLSYSVEDPTKVSASTSLSLHKYMGGGELKQQGNEINDQICGFTTTFEAGEDVDIRSRRYSKIAVAHKQGKEHPSKWDPGGQVFVLLSSFMIWDPGGSLPSSEIYFFLHHQITGLVEGYPELMSLRSVDLSPASWMAVSWYPIYHIPMGRTIKDLSTCFLTYHTLSSSFQDMNLDDDTDGAHQKRKEGEGISLPPFGLATYKMQGDLWVSGHCGRDREMLVSLLNVADSWLKQLRVQHHDFNYFTGIRHG